MKYLVYRERNGKREYKRTKTRDFWTKDSDVCWQYSKQGAKKIVDREKSFSKGFYEYGMVEASIL